MFRPFFFILSLTYIEVKEGASLCINKKS